MHHAATAWRLAVVARQRTAGGRVQLGRTPLSAPKRALDRPGPNGPSSTSRKRSSVRSSLNSPSPSPAPRGSGSRAFAEPVPLPPVEGGKSVPTRQLPRAMEGVVRRGLRDGLPDRTGGRFRGPYQPSAAAACYACGAGRRAGADRGVVVARGHGPHPKRASVHGLARFRDRPSTPITGKRRRGQPLRPGPQRGEDAQEQRCGHRSELAPHSSTGRTGSH